MVVQNSKKPVSNLSSALASIQISKNNTHNGSSGHPPYPNDPYHNNHHNHNHSDIPKYHDFNDPSRISQFSNTDTSHNQNYHAVRSIDIPVARPDPLSQLPFDRIAEYRRNPPSDGISLFSHRVGLPYTTFVTLEVLSYFLFFFP